MNKYVIFLLLINSLISSSQEIKQPELTLINTYGSIIYEEPNLSSNEITQLDFGEKILLLKDSIKQVKVPYPNNFELNGNWIRVKYNNSIGYVKSTDFTDKDLLSTKSEFKLDFNQLLGKELSIKTKIDSMEYEGRVYTRKSIITKYDNGEIRKAPFDGCWNDYYTFYNYNMHEIYHLMMDKYRYEERYEDIHRIFPKYIKTEDGEYKFEDDFLSEYYISHLKENNSIVLYITGCN